MAFEAEGCKMRKLYPNLNLKIFLVLYFACILMMETKNGN
jgi:hypothetical protein